MRVLTVSELKRENRRVRNDYPSDGSFAFEVWQQLKSNTGHSVDLRVLAHSRGRTDQFLSAISTLRDMYGMDIRKVRPRGFLYILAGEWFGSHYTDYCAAAFKAGRN